MNPILARVLSGFIPNRQARRAFRDFLMNNANSAYLSRRIHVRSLHEYVTYYKKIGEILAILTPYSVIGVPKVRIGGKGDGGYVMLDPGRNGGVAYSLGVSPHSPWDLEMASRGYEVFQFDGTIENPPDSHPNLHFQKVNIVSPEDDKQGKGKSMDRLFRELGHEEKNDIILQMDIEGGEWDVLRHLSESEMRKFRQIIIEFHDMTPTSESLPDKLEILKAISRTHKPVHIHLNNCGCRLALEEGLLFYSPAWEVTYARAEDYEFEPCVESFPTPLDSPNSDGDPDIEIGCWRH